MKVKIQAKLIPKIKGNSLFFFELDLIPPFIASLVAVKFPFLQPYNQFINLKKIKLILIVDLTFKKYIF